MKFHIDQFQVERVAKAGAWLVTCPSPVDLGMLFLKPQEFYESGNPKFCGQAFTVAEFMAWYIDKTRDDNKPSPNVFSYFEDFQGYNLPSTAVELYLSTPQAETSVWDVRFARIASVIHHVQHGLFYLIGAPSTKLSVIEHELAHAMWYLMPGYREQQTLNLADLSVDEVLLTKKALAEEGYSESVFMDETQAYMATGLLESMENLEGRRMPFMKAFARWKRKFIPPKRAARSAGT